MEMYAVCLKQTKHLAHPCFLENLLIQGAFDSHSVVPDICFFVCISANVRPMSSCQTSLSPKLTDKTPACFNPRQGQQSSALYVYMQGQVSARVISCKLCVCLCDAAQGRERRKSASAGTYTLQPLQTSMLPLNFPFKVSFHIRSAPASNATQDISRVH